MEKKKPYFIGDCIGASANFVNTIMDKAVDITYKTLVKHVGEYQLKMCFPNYDWNKPGLHLGDDCAVSFHRAKYKGKWIYIVRHSSIEYFWRML